jgi:hypothetical protein
MVERPLFVQEERKKQRGEKWNTRLVLFPTMSRQRFSNIRHSCNSLPIDDLARKKRLELQTQAYPKLPDGENAISQLPKSLS